MKILIIFIGMLFNTACLHAQTNYYTTTKTFNQDSYIYQCDVRTSGFVTLYNKSNKLTKVYPVYKNRGDFLYKQMRALNCLKMIIGLVLNVNLCKYCIL